MDAPAGFALGEQMRQPLEFFHSVAAQHGFDGLVAESLILQFITDPPARRQAQLQAERAGNLGEEGIKGADSHPVQVPHGVLEHAEALVPVEPGLLDALGQFLPVTVVGGGAGQAVEDSVEDLAGGLASERRSQDPLDGLPTLEQADETVGQLVRLAGSRGSADDQVVRSVHDG